MNKEENLDQLKPNDFDWSIIQQQSKMIQAMSKEEFARYMKMSFDDKDKKPCQTQ